MRERSFADKLRECFPDEHTDEMKIGKNFTRTITLQVTEDCNMACTYCYQHDKTRKSMSIETGKKFIDLILDSDERSSKYITSKNGSGVILEFIGGEPLIEIDLIDELTDYFIEQLIVRDHPWSTRFCISICTNGLLYFDERVQNYIRKNRAHLDLSITLDGDKKIHDKCRLDKNGNPTYDRVVAAIEHYINYWHGNVGSKVTISPENVEYISDAIIDMIQRGYKQINLNCVYEEGWEISHARLIYKQLKTISDYIFDNGLEDDVFISMLDLSSGTNFNTDNTWCGGCGLMMAVAPDGNIYPCLRYTPSSIGKKQKPYVIGTVEKGLMQTAEEEQRVKCFECVTRKTQFAGTKCETCPISDGCGDCIAYSYEVTGDVGKRTTYHCDTHKARVLAASYHQNRRYREHDSDQRYALNIPYDWAREIVDDNEFRMLVSLADDGRNSVCPDGTYRISIPEELRDYMQRLKYEINARKDLLAFFFERELPQKDMFNEYYQEYLEFCTQYELAKEEISHKYVYNLYPHCPWDIDFIYSEIVVKAECI